MLVPAPGRLLDSRYQLLTRLGSGGMGDVWSASDTKTGNQVAIKLLHRHRADNEDTRRRLLREARAARAVRHPNVVEVLDIFEVDPETPAVVMEFLEGETLGQKLDREGRLELGELVGLVLPILSALRRAHSVGVVHRDLKPDNIFLAIDYRSPTQRLVTPKILDFGVAKLTATEGIAARSQSPSTVRGALLGTPMYMSPEQLLGETTVDHRTDIWSLGVLIFECLSGQFPSTQTLLGPLLMQITTGRLQQLRQLVSFVPADIDGFVMQMLSVSPEARPTLETIEGALLPYAPTIA